MSLKRRGFLQMLGGALAAPLMPTASVGAATKAAYPASALHAAIYHAKARVNFSVYALSQRLGVDLAQAEQIMMDMSARGILGPIQGTTQSGRWALSKVWERPKGSIVAAQKLRAKSLTRQADQMADGRCASRTRPTIAGRQGEKGSTDLVSPGMAAAAAITGKHTAMDQRMYARGLSSRVKTKTPGNLPGVFHF